MLMFACFNFSTDKDFRSYRETGELIYNNNKANIKKSLSDYFDINGSINGTELQENWFPEIDADIFISHSHKDEGMAIGLAGLLYEKFGLKVFIDSCVWGYSLDLQKEIDKEFCLIDEEKDLYDYQKVMYSTSHVHMMLSTALTKMLDKSEGVFFLNTPNSISANDTINQTESPWIYHEIAMTKMIRRRELSEYRRVMISKGVYGYEMRNESLDVKYNVDLGHMIELTNFDLDFWELRKEVCNDVKYPLDILYKIKNIIKE